MKILLKKSGCCIITFILFFLSITVQAAEVTKKDLKTERDKVSYSIGLDVGKDFKQKGFDIDTWIFYKGLKDGFNDKTPLMSEDDIKKIMSTYMEKMQKQMKTQQYATGGKNIQEGKKFLAKNKTKSGVKTTASGLQYKVITQGKGKKPKPTDTVTVHYEGRLINGTVFDSSYERKSPASFPLNRVIKGWTEGLLLMQPGSKYEFYIPSDLAYGPRGAGENIGPNATLIFVVELLEIK